MARTANWCFTLNNPQDEEVKAIDQLVPEHAKYLVYGREVGENGTPHLQGYAEFNRRVVFNTAKRILGGRVHLEVRRGSFTQAVDYCKKDGDFVELGTPQTQGRRSDLAEIREEIVDGRSDLELADEHFAKWCVYRRSFSAYRTLHRGSLGRSKPRVETYVGQTGVGKTRYVHHRHSGERIWIYPGGGWFDGYEGQAVCFFDDYRGDIALDLFLRVLDRYSIQVPVKGSFVSWTPKRIYITSNTHLSLWYNYRAEADYAALLRRMDRVELVTEPIYSDIE